MTRVAIVAAMPGELKPLVRGWRHQRRNGVDLWRQPSAQGEWVAACAGAGVDAATRAFAEIEKHGPVHVVISTGWAGALSEEFLPGRVYAVSSVIDARTGEGFTAESFPAPERNQDMQTHPGDKNKNVARMGHPVSSPPSQGRSGLWLVTSSKVADEVEKRRLAESYRAGLVDMEAAAIARLAAMRGMPFYCVKGVSDGFTDQLPDFNRFIDANGQFQLTRFILFVLFCPRHWPALIRMGENSKKAAMGIREFLLENLVGHIG